MTDKTLKKTAEKRRPLPRPESKVEHKQRISTEGRANENASKPVSLAPLSFEEALGGLLKVKPRRERG